MHKFRNLSTERLASSFSKAGNEMHLSQNIQSTSYFDTWEDVNTKSQYPKTLKSNHFQIRFHKTLYLNNYFNFHIYLSICLAIIWQSLIKLALKYAFWFHEAGRSWCYVTRWGKAKLHMLKPSLVFHHFSVSAPSSCVW